MFILILFSLMGWSAWSESFDEDSYFIDRDLSSIIEFIPSKEQFRCVPRCDGASYCGEIRSYDACLDPQLFNACFWTCE